MDNSLQFESQDLSIHLLQSVESISKREGYIHCNIEIKDFDTKGGNFLGDVFEINLKGETENGKKETNIFVKQKISLDTSAIMSADEIYGIEEFFYKELAGIFAHLQDEAQVPQEERFKLPKHYRETNSDAIILENMSNKGYKTYNRLKAVPLKFLELTVKELARFHGLSFVIEKRMPQYHNKRIKVLEHPLHYNENWDCLMRKTCTYVANLCDDATKAKLLKFIPIFLEKFRRYNTDKTSTKCALTHGNCKTNNILVREDKGEAAEVMIIDYQFMDYGCPIRDLYFTILSNTDKNIRRNHMNDLKELYFDSLSRYLKYFDLNVETVYPREEFEKVYSEWFDYGLMKMFFSLPFMFASETGVDLKSVNYGEIPFRLDKNAQDKVLELIKDFVDWDCL